MSRMLRTAPTIMLLQAKPMAAPIAMAAPMANILFSSIVKRLIIQANIQKFNNLDKTKKLSVKKNSPA